MWGQDSIRVAIAPDSRIIPMRVGTRFLSAPAVAFAEDHPHACGDKLETLSRRACISGSSPCVWGQGREKHRLYQYDGIIPMRVGTSTMIYNNSLGAEDHPHACGDKWYFAHRTGIMQGSSPCVWGQGDSTLSKTGTVGIIPMRVGTSLKAR